MPWPILAGCNPRHACNCSVTYNIGRASTQWSCLHERGGVVGAGSPPPPLCFVLLCDLYVCSLWHFRI